MLAFSRITSILLFVLSLSFLTCALPSPAPGTQALAAPGAGEKCHGLLVDLKAKVDVHVDVMIKAKVIGDVNAEVGYLVANVKTCAEAIVALGAKIDIDAQMKAKIAVEVAAIITVMVKACVSLVAKFGLVLCLSILARIDTCLQLLLLNLGVCVEGIIALVANIVVKIGVKVFVGVNLNLCVAVLGLLKL